MKDPGFRGPVLGLLFDLDGTLFDTFDQLLQAQNEALAVFREPPLSAAELRPLVGIPLAKQMEILRGLTGPRVAAINEEYYRRFQRLLEANIRLYPGVRETLAALRSRRIGTMTTRRQKVADRMLRLAGVREFFTAVVGGDEVDRPKPEPDLPRHAAKALGLAPSECAIVGDASVDILAGRAAGTWTVAALYGYGDRREVLATKPHKSIERFEELPRVLEDLERLANP